MLTTIATKSLASTNQLHDQEDGVLRPKATERKWRFNGDLMVINGD